MKSSRKRRRRSSSEDRRPRRYRSGSREPARKGNKTKRKRTPQEDTPATPTQVCVSPPPPEESGTSVRELLPDRERLLEHLFLSVAPDALGRLVPPHLQGRPTEDLKRLCLLQLRLMSEECVLDIAAGKEPPPLVPAVEEESVDQIVEGGSADESAPEKAAETPPSSGGAPATRGGAGLSTRSCNVPSPEKTTAASSSSPLDHHLLLDDTEMQTVVGEENLVPPAPEDGDLELLELEMRARAIRALLRARAASNQQPLDHRPGGPP